ncbi:hypothetical protein SAMN05216436_10227 [bacterium A37T11]|nr:hypothetical protein SAMN05216436_10227 [bacterium A37T11]
MKKHVLIKSTYRGLLIVMLGAFALPAVCQYHPKEIFNPDFYRHPGSEWRSASGKPGANYWQNRADYIVKASFDTASQALKGNVEIQYSNQSPEVLDELWLQLDQNTNRLDSRGNRQTNPDAQPDDALGYIIREVRLEQDGKWIKIPYSIEDTRMQIRFAKRPVKAGQLVKLSIDYAYTLQKSGGGGRSGYMDTKNGKLYEFSYWYPRMCVYDDYYGWNTLPFIGSGEMYLDYGHIDYSVTVPAGLLVVGTGKLVNESEVLNARLLGRLVNARSSDATVMVRPARELNQPVTKKSTGLVTWHFQMDSTRDVAWALSKAFIWDAARINLPEGKTALAQSVYPIESTAGSIAWPRSTQFLKASIEHYSEKWFPFPYDVATSVAGPVGGMEFPGLAFNGWKADPYIMFLLDSHEIGHTWFPMIVGSDERRYPFMDEGFNTFINILAHETFNKGEFAPKRDGEYAPGKGYPADEIVEVIKSSGEDNTLMTPPDAMKREYVHPLAYFKSALGLTLLRDVILGPDKFDYAFRQYIHNWAFKHPRPDDFFRSMENGAGEDLSWFWQGWYYHNWQLDQAVVALDYEKGDPAKGAIIKVENKQQMVMPIIVAVKETNGQEHCFTVPVDVWQKGPTATFHVNSTTRVVSVILDPEHQLPDMDRSNNEYKP